MVTTDLIRKIRYLKANPRLAELVPQSDMIVLMGSLLEGFQVLQKAIEENKLKGDKGEPGYTPRPGVDYAPLDAFTKALAGFSAQYADLADRIEQKLATVQDGRAGKDAEITDELKAELAEAAAALIELPDFGKLLTMEPEAIRNSLELLQGDERLSIDAISGLRERLDELVGYVGRVSGGTIGKQQVYNWIRQAVSDGTIPAGGGSGVTYETPTGTIDGVNQVFGVSARPKCVFYRGVPYFEGANGYSYTTLQITMPFAPSHDGAEGGDISDQFKAQF